ncbi:major facilitator superfamily domain-containing protein 10 isoform X3 [Balaenoptera musculus]|uniref:Major facilitator superfamily domain-containing protein 10 isoform X3 n=1 Tax=Balaenoptera musculus TaxID=9771 RepID=A0A8B8XJ75_BALMU|nr:major facilitator superfamily domain-containing protein 10 isoform X3 [Balaenoptera musculus]
MPHPGPWDGWPPGLRLLCVTPAACVSCCPGSGAGCTEGLLCWVTGQADPLGARWLFAGWGHGRSWGSVSPQVGGCGAGVPKRALVRRAVLQTRHTLSQAGSERPPSWAGEPAGAAPRAHPSASSRHPKPEWSLWSSSASCWTSWPSPCCCPCYLRCWSATAVCRILSMARGSAGWTGLLQPLGCQPRRGLIGSVFSLLQFLSAPLTGAVSDCLGRRPVLLLSLAGLATSYAVWATSKSFAAFLVSRIIGGISKGNVSLSTAIVADLGSSPARSRGMAVIGVAFSLAFTLGPMLGASLPVETAPWLALLFAVSDLLFIFCFLPETLPPEKRAPSITLGFRAAVDLLSPLALLCFSAVARGPDPPIGVRLGSLRLLGLVYFLYLFLFSGLEFTLSFLVHQRFQFSSLEQGKMFFFIGLTMATIQGAYARRISPGGEIAAVKRVRGLPWAWGQAAPRALRRQRGGPETGCAARRPSCCSSPPSSSSAGGTRCPCWAWGCCSTPSALPGRRAWSWARCGAWAPWPGLWGPRWPPQCTGWPGPGSATPCARGSSCSPSPSCGS